MPPSIRFAVPPIFTHSLPAIKTFAPALLALLLPLTASANELSINFDDHGYRVGERLWGQGARGAVWSSHCTDIFEVVSGDGVNGSNAFRINACDLDYNNASLDFPPRVIRLAG